VCDRIVETVGRLIFQAGVFTADPHAGNCLVDDNNNIGLVDMGCCARLSTEERVKLAELILAIHRGAPGPVARLWHDHAAFHTKTNDPEVVARIATLALSHFDFRPIRGVPVLQILKDPRHKPTSGQVVTWLPPVQRATEILRGLANELGLRELRLCDAWAHLARDTLLRNHSDKGELSPFSIADANRRPREAW